MLAKPVPRGFCPRRSSIGSSPLARSTERIWLQPRPPLRQRSWSSRWSRRYQRRPLSDFEGTFPRLARAFSATTEHPITAAAAGAGSQTCSLSGGIGPVGGAVRRSSSASAALVAAMPLGPRRLSGGATVDRCAQGGHRAAASWGSDCRAHRGSRQPAPASPTRTCPAG